MYFILKKVRFRFIKKLDELENEFKDMGFVRAHLSFLVNELNQIGIKIDMYRQEYRFTPAFAFIQAV